MNVGDQIELEIVPLQTAGTFAGVSLTIDLVFAGDPGTANCQGQSASALAQQYGSLNVNYSKSLAKQAFGRLRGFRKNAST